MREHQNTKSWTSQFVIACVSSDENPKYIVKRGPRGPRRA